MPLFSSTGAGAAPTQQRHHHPHQFSHLRGKLSSVAKTFTPLDNSPRGIRPPSSSYSTSSPRQNHQDDGGRVVGGSSSGRPIPSPRVASSATSTIPSQSNTPRMFGSGLLRAQSASLSGSSKRGSSTPSTPGGGGVVGTPSSVQRLPPTSPRQSQTGSVFNVQLRDALYSCTSGMSCLLNACERYVESIDLTKLLLAEGSHPSPTLEEERSQPLSSSSSHLGDQPSSTTTGPSNRHQIIKKAVAAFILDVGALKKLHVDESCHAVLTILSQTAMSSHGGRPSSSSSTTRSRYHSSVSRPPSAASRPPSASSRHQPPPASDAYCDRDLVIASDSPLTWGLVASQLFIVRLRESISCLRSGAVNVHTHTSGAVDVSGSTKKSTGGLVAPESALSGVPVTSRASHPSRPSSACPAPLWSRRSSSSSIATTTSSSSPTTLLSTSSSSNRNTKHLPRGLMQLQSEATAVMESIHALQSLVDSMCDRDQETTWIRGSEKFLSRVPSSKASENASSSSVGDDGPHLLVTEFISSVNASIFPRSCRWIPALERQAAAAAAAISACTQPPPSSSSVDTPIVPAPPPPKQQPQQHGHSRPSTAGGYTRFRQVPLGSGEDQTSSPQHTSNGTGGSGPTSQQHPSSSVTPSAVVKLAPLDTVLALDNKQWLTLTKNGSVSLRDLIDDKCVPWPTNCLLRICDEVGLPRDVVLKIRASHIPKDKQQSGHGGVSKAVPSDVRETIVRYLKILQRRWHPDRFHHALGGGGGDDTDVSHRRQRQQKTPPSSSAETAVINLYASELSDDDDGDGDVGRGNSRTNDNAVLAQATLVAQSINAIRDAMGDY